MISSDSGSEVAQLYLRFPAAAQQPDLVLRAFAKTALLGPGDEALLCFGLAPRDLSVWDEAAPDVHGGARPGAWRLARGEFGVRVGASSRDIRLEATVEV